MKNSRVIIFDKIHVEDARNHAHHRRRDTEQTATNDTSLESAQKLKKYTREPAQSARSSRRETRAKMKIHVFAIFFEITVSTMLQPGVVYLYRSSPLPNLAQELAHRATSPRTVSPQVRRSPPFEIPLLNHNSSLRGENATAGKEYHEQCHHA